ncbi:MAG: hypothetical protein M3Q58_14500 [Bacteroidota bacterium]|nr:hypothetical protein [Bacteroidota bacterium]
MKILTLWLKCLIILIIYKNASAQSGSIFQPIDIGMSTYNKTERYKQFEGREIRKINIVTLDPIGSTVEDTTINYIPWYGKTLNKLHTTTRKSVIENLLLIKEGEIFDALATRETERLIRDAAFVKDTRIIISEIDDHMVDITIIVSDLFSTNISIISFEEPITIRLHETNFLGLAHDIDNTFSYDFKKKTDFSINGSYTIPYIHNTYASITALYEKSPTRQTKGLIINRSFFSPLTDWAGGIGLIENHLFPEQAVANGINPFETRFIEQDYWIGRNFNINKQERNSRFGIAARINQVYYSLKPPLQSDTLQIHQNSVFFLGTLAYNLRQYYIDRNIYRFGITEDIPRGMLIALTGGYQQKELLSRPYIRARLAYGDHFSGFGNFSTSIDVGTFIYKGKKEQGSLNYSLSYFSDMFKVGSWGFRQFINSLTIVGINRLPNESVTLSDNFELYGFPGVVSGTKKTSLNFQSVLYAPFSVIGFRFAPVILIGFGMIGNNNNPLLQGTVYQSYGAGILIRNESIAFRTFQLSIAIYPHLPGFDSPDYSINPVGTFDLRYTDFFIDRPGEVPYR